MSRLLSICLPTYEMGGVGHVFLKESLDKLLTQTFTDFDVVVSDFSKDTLIKDLCAEYKGKLDITYYKNTNLVVGMSTNTNNAIEKATGKLLKILFQDDFLYDDKALETIVSNFDLEKDTWQVTGCIHTTDGTTFTNLHKPRYNKQVYLGKNTIGSPSVLTIKNDKPLLFDLNLTWLVDCDYYRRYYDLFGAPKIVDTVITVIRTGDHQITNTEATTALRKREYTYMVKKYSRKLQLPTVTLVAVSSVHIPETIRALEISQDGIDFHDAILISDQKPDHLPENITLIPCDPIKSIDEYSKYMVFDLAEHITTDFALVVQHDGYVLRPDMWQDTFFKYDYIGAPWPKNTHFTDDGTEVRIGNGGFSLRSKKLLNIMNTKKLPFTDGGKGYFNEDGIYCVYYRKQLEKMGITYPPVSVAAAFSHETDCEDSVRHSFGFHKNKRAIPRFFFIKHHLHKLLSTL